MVIAERFKIKPTEVLELPFDVFFATMDYCNDNAAEHEAWQ